MRLSEFKNKKINIKLESFINGFTNNCKNKIKSLIQEFEVLVKNGSKKENDFFDFLEENYEKTL